MNAFSDNNVLGTTAIVLLLALVAFATVIDFKSHRIPNILLFPALSIALILHTINGGVDGLIMTTSGLAIGLAMLLPLYVTGGMGAGDVKLLGVVGSCVGPWGAVVAGLATMMAGAVFGIVVIVWHRVWPILEFHAAQLVNGRDTGAERTLLSHSSYSKDRITHMPYAAAIAAGTLAALWYLDLLPDQLLGLT